MAHPFRFLAWQQQQQQQQRRIDLTRLLCVSCSAWREWVLCFRGLGPARSVIYACLVLGTICGVDFSSPLPLLPPLPCPSHLVGLLATRPLRHGVFVRDLRRGDIIDRSSCA